MTPDHADLVRELRKFQAEEPGFPQIFDRAAAAIERLTAARDSNQIATNLRRLGENLTSHSGQMACEEGASEIERLSERCEAYKGQVEAGAKEIERLTAERDEAMDMLGDVPGKTLAERLTNYIGEYMSMQARADAAESRLKAALAVLQGCRTLLALLVDPASNPNASSMHLWAQAKALETAARGVLKETQHVEG